MPSSFRVFWKGASLSCYRKPVKVTEAVGLKGDIPQETRSLMPSHFRFFWKKASLSCIVWLKGDILRKTVVILKTPTS